MLTQRQRFFNVITVDEIGKQPSCLNDVKIKHVEMTPITVHIIPVAILWSEWWQLVGMMTLTHVSPHRIQKS